LIIHVLEILSSNNRVLDLLRTALLAMPLVVWLALDKSWTLAGVAVAGELQFEDEIVPAIVVELDGIRPAVRSDILDIGIVLLQFRVEVIAWITRPDGPFVILIGGL
jgi:hypothetical protein